MNVERRVEAGLRKTWEEVLGEDLRVKRLSRQIARDCVAYRLAIR